MLQPRVIITVDVVASALVNIDALLLLQIGSALSSSFFPLYYSIFSPFAFGRFFCVETSAIDLLL